ncbi:MAG TPA: hypothetical protein VFD05_02375 [Bacilli bacterium]|nr:hypothetical protein [Bacilli bacterium]
MLFFLPVSLRFLKLVFRTSERVISKDINVSYKDLLALPLYKGSYIDITSQDGVKVKIKTI